jgi:hypothetical protein
MIPLGFHQIDANFQRLPFYVYPKLLTRQINEIVKINDRTKELPINVKLHPI